MRNVPYFLRAPMITFIGGSYGGDWLPHLVVSRRVDFFAGPFPTVMVYVTWSPWSGFRKWAMR